MKNKILLFVLLSFTSCETETECKYKQTIVKTKTIDLYNGSTRYNIAFTNGESHAFEFGLYSKYEVGDTICWQNCDSYQYWYTSCKKLK